MSKYFAARLTLLNLKFFQLILDYPNLILIISLLTLKTYLRIRNSLKVPLKRKLNLLIIL
jgi:hypothetical protein